MQRKQVTKTVHVTSVLSQHTLYTKCLLIMLISYVMGCFLYIFDVFMLTQQTDEARPPPPAFVSVAAGTQWIFIYLFSTGQKNPTNNQ